MTSFLVLGIFSTLLLSPVSSSLLRFKAHLALQQVMEDSRDSLVLIFLQDVTDYRLSRSLLIRRGMLKSRCIVHWPLQKERIPAFQQKLQIALNSSNRVD